MADRGRAGTGAVLSLYAEGRQDTYLSGKDGETFFKEKTIKHTNFSTTYNPHYVYKDPGIDTWPMGQEIKFKLNPKISGDILSNAFLKCTLPALQPGESYCQQIGNAIIKEVKFIVNGTVFDRRTHDWVVIQKELFFNESEKRCLDTLIGDDVNPNPGTIPIPLYIPLNLFFCRSKSKVYDDRYVISDNFFKPYYLLCASYNDDIELSITFHKQAFFSNATTTTISLDSINLITTEHTLTDKERLFYQTNKQLQVINNVTVQSVLDIPQGDETFKNFLTPTVPIKSFHWFLRNKDFENDNDSTNFLKRYNFGSDYLSSNIFQENSNVIMADAKIFLNGDNQVGFQGNFNTSERTVGNSYYKYLQNFDHYLHTPDRNIYTYSFAIDPSNPTPTGAINLSSMSSSKTVLEGTVFNEARSNAYNMHLFYLGYSVVNYENGFASLAFT
jgi:hypothetical protein